MAARKLSGGDRVTKIVCKSGLAISWLIGIGITAFGIWSRATTKTYPSHDYYIVKPIVQEMLPLVLNLLVTFLCECMGYIHTCSLRWALYRDGRLDFNTNLRMLTGSRTSRSNSWYANAVYFIGILMSYVSTSMLYIGYNSDLEGLMYDLNFVDSYSDEIDINGVAVVALGIGILLQAFITTWSLVATDMPCWSSNPLVIARACMNDSKSESRCTHRPGRCMMGVHSRSLAEAEDVFPTSPQRAMFTAHSMVRWALVLVAIVPIFCLLWGGITYAVIYSGKRAIYTISLRGTSWALLPTFSTKDHIATPTFGIYFGDTTSEGHWTSVLSYMAIITLFQVPITFGLHCAELLVNLSRDEAVYREMEGPKGAQAVYSSGTKNSKNSKNANASGNNKSHSRSPILAAFLAWETVVLFLFKTVAHWLFGLATGLWYYVGVCMFVPQIFYLGVLTTFLFLLCAFLAFRRYRGFLPSAFGHIQTIVDIIDEWPYDPFFDPVLNQQDGILMFEYRGDDDREYDPGPGSKLFWGHKSRGETPDKPYYAGTSTTHPLPPPFNSHRYGGDPPSKDILNRQSDASGSSFMRLPDQIEQQEPFMEAQF